MRSGKKRTITGFGVLLLFLLAGSVVLYLNFKTVVVSGTSMTPTLKNGQRVLVSHAYWLVGPIQHGDIVVVKDNNPDGYMIKRVFKMGGEEVDYYNYPRNYSMANGSYVVPKGTLFLLGDNRMNSEDSRSIGPVPVSYVLGKVVVWR